MMKTMLRATMLVLGATAMAVVAADPRLDAGNWRLRVTSVTNGTADADQDAQVCLGDELKDLTHYFMPVLEGVPAKCTTTRMLTVDKRIIRARLRCSGNKFTYEAETRVVIEGPQRFTLSLNSLAKTPTETGRVSMSGQGDFVGPCKAP